MATAVQIVISVDPSNSGTAIDGIQHKLNEMGVVGTTSLKKVGDATGVAGQGLNGLNGHMATSLDGVRLLSQEFGLRLPRALESILSRVPAVTEAISAMLGVFAAIAVVEVGARVIQSVYKLYEKWLDVDKVTQQYTDKLREAATLKMLDPGNADSALQSLQQINAEIEKLNDKRSTGGLLGPLLGNHELYTTTDEKRRVELFQQRDALQANAGKYQAEDIEKGDEQMKKFAQSTMGARAQLKALYDVETQQNIHRYQAVMQRGDDPITASKKLEDAQQNTDLEFRAKQMQQGKRERDERIAMQDEAVRAGLKGEEVYAAQRTQAIEKVTRAFSDGEIAKRTWQAETAAIEEKFDNEHAARVKAQMERATDMVHVAQRTGLKGASQIGATRDDDLGKIDRRVADKLLDPAAAEQERIAVRTTANQKLLDLQQQFSERMQQIEESRVDKTLGGFERIQAAAQREIDRVNQEFNRSYGGPGVDHSSAPYTAAEQSKQNAVTAIQAAAQDQRRDLTQRNREEDLRYDQEALAAEARVREDGMLGWVASYRNAMSEIQALENEHLAKLEIDAAKEGLTYEEIARRRVDIERTANAQIAAQAQALQHKIAGTLEAAFKDPIGTIKSLMEKMMFDILAKWVMQLGIFKQIFGNILNFPGTQSAGGATGSGIGAVLGQATGSAGWGGGVAPPQPSSDAPWTPPILQQVPPVIASSFAGSSANFPIGGSSSAGTAPGTPPIVAGSSNGAAISSVANNQRLGYGAAAAGAYLGYQTTRDAFVNGDPIHGALGDAAAGAAIGAVVGGPVGALVGAGIGAVVGLTAGLAGLLSGESGKLSARDYYRKNLFPAIEAERNNLTNVDFQTGISNVNRIESDGMVYMSQHFGRNAASWVWSNYLKKEVDLADSSIIRRAQGGAQFVQMSAPEFHTGGYINGFGSMGTSSTEGYIHAMLGEAVVNRQATALHAPTINAMNSGASASDIAAMYLAGAGTGPGGSSRGSGGDTHHHWDVTAMDAKSFSQMLRSGGARAISKELNTFARQYAGDGIVG